MGTSSGPGVKRSGSLLFREQSTAWADEAALVDGWFLSMRHYGSTMNT